MGNPNKIGGQGMGNEIPGQVGMDEWIERNSFDKKNQERIAGVYKRINTTKSVDELNSYLKQLDDYLEGIDSSDHETIERKTKEFDGYRQAIEDRRSELYFDGYDDQTLTDMATSPDLSETTSSFAMREIERRQAKGVYDLDKKSDNKGFWKGLDKVSDGDLEDYATSPDVDSGLSDAAQAEIKRREGIAFEKNKDAIPDNMGGYTDGEYSPESDQKPMEYSEGESYDDNTEDGLDNSEVKDDNSEKISTLEKELERVSQSMQDAREKGDDNAYAIARSEYSRIVAEIYDLKNKNKTEIPTDNIEDGSVGDGEGNASKKDERIGDDEYRRWQKEQMMNYSALSDNERAKFDKSVKPENDKDLSGINFDNEGAVDYIAKKYETGESVNDSDYDEAFKLQKANVSKEFSSGEFAGNTEGDGNDPSREGSGDDAAKFDASRMSVEEFSSSLEKQREKYYAEVDRRANELKRQFDEKINKLIEEFEKAYGILNGEVGEEISSDKKDGEDGGAASAPTVGEAGSDNKETEKDKVNYFEDNAGFLSPDRWIQTVAVDKEYTEGIEGTEKYNAACEQFKKDYKDISSEFNEKYEEINGSQDELKKEEDLSKLLDNTKKKIEDLSDTLILRLRVLHGVYEKQKEQGKQNTDSKKKYEEAIGAVDGGERFAEEGELDVLARYFGDNTSDDDYDAGEKTPFERDADAYAKTEPGLKAQFEHSEIRSTIRDFDVDDLAGVSINEVYGALESALEEDGKNDKHGRYRKLIERKYRELGLDSDGNPSGAEVAKKTSFVRQAARKIREVLRMEDSRGGE